VVSSFAEENLMQIMPGRAEKYSIFKMGHNFSMI
jgi:hypothetical protein